MLEKNYKMSIYTTVTSTKHVLSSGMAIVLWLDDNLQVHGPSGLWPRTWLAKLSTKKLLNLYLLCQLSQLISKEQQGNNWKVAWILERKKQRNPGKW